MDWKDKRVFITGATGFIGSHLTRKLKELGADIFVLAHKRLPDEQIIYHRDDINDLGDDFGINLRWFNPEYIFHLAAQPLVSVAMVNEKSTLDANTRGTYNLLNICKTLKGLKSFVHISTDKVYGNIPNITDDSVPFGVHHPYNTSKLAGDVIAQMYSNFFNIPMVIVRNCNVYGAGDTHFDRIVPRTIRKIIENERPIVRGDGTNTRDYIHVSEIVDGYIKSAGVSQDKISILNLCGFNHSVTKVVDTIVGKMNRVDLAPIYEEQWKGEIPHQHIVNQSAKELIGWNPQIGIEAGIDLTIPWYQKWYKEQYGT